MQYRQTARVVFYFYVLSVTFIGSIVLLQVRELVEAMHEKTVAKGCYVIREGESDPVCGVVWCGVVCVYVY